MNLNSWNAIMTFIISYTISNKIDHHLHLKEFMYILPYNCVSWPSKSFKHLISQLTLFTTWDGIDGIGKGRDFAGTSEQDIATIANR